MENIKFMNFLKCGGILFISSLFIWSFIKSGSHFAVCGEWIVEGWPTMSHGGRCSLNVQDCTLMVVTSLRPLIYVMEKTVSKISSTDHGMLWSTIDISGTHVHFLSIFSFVIECVTLVSLCVCSLLFEAGKREVWNDLLYYADHLFSEVDKWEVFITIISNREFKKQTIFKTLTEKIRGKVNYFVTTCEMIFGLGGLDGYFSKH